MLKSTALFFLFVFIFSAVISAQSVTGRLSDEKGDPIAYATVFAPGAETGALTDESGAFEIDLKTMADSCRVQFSCIGYETRLLTAGEVRTLPDPATLELSSANYVLETANIAAERIRMKRKKLGMNGIMNGTFIYNPGEKPRPLEFGTMLSPDGRARLDEVLIKVRSMKADSVLVDINIYDVRFGMVGEPLLKGRVFLRLSREDIREEISIDLSGRGLYVERSFLVTFRVLKVVGAFDELRVSAKTGDGNGFRRGAAGRWRETYLTPNIRARVAYAKE